MDATKKMIGTASVQTVQEMITTLEAFIARTTGDGDVLYVENHKGVDFVTLQLIENTLTDGSKTYDVSIA